VDPIHIQHFLIHRQRSFLPNNKSLYRGCHELGLRDLLSLTLKPSSADRGQLLTKGCTISKTGRFCRGSQQLHGCAQFFVSVAMVVEPLTFSVQ
jgi:hypothetical protein